MKQLLVSISATFLVAIATGCSSMSQQEDPTTCGEVYSNDLSVTSKQHHFPIRFREVNELRVDKMGWGLLKNSAGVIKLEPGKHRLEVFIVSKNNSLNESPLVIDRQKVDVTVERDKAYELLAYEKQGEDKTLQKGKGFKILINKEESRVCDGGRIFELPEEAVFDDE